ncbi:rab9 effector protein with kelch motifs-like isoform X1 [Lingula anatina]|uniref:Rab9 effector protein with kelch motifs n=1 Tax=Lingula anatina TaxID=7574 RepID=A0A1S3H341_LINAN|nr:rab9 effector protein with kelch motifs-like isoform X1 [Lingula anatina]XP_013380429.1 rab9 effector protein with kelch motifs-like isoform X1 [Lingula anatina]XP_013380430.1 rab9 effector protein with kelch motifs-like isoform X1 [Lingula anatina]XP_013380431.1 rab9 effector protein with kelch motifs-like isoform X1 [Lingula anatina]XP_013380432.1 rab9 effector protein with kelch motifs-like isoform X1 [Lingula anatina]XP_013380433.1 rab9 effector protein with kelch motifs-like isoform X1|eukprot:XP_013380428.1 rab9 effector protein with kelch motifs-like isoform X1 [Lingula anatina]
MDLQVHPILEKNTTPNPALWYVFSSTGESPTMRVGHTCTFIPGQDGNSRKVFCIGGANPSGPFNEVYILDLETFQWDTCESPALIARYEHSAFVPQSQPGKIYIFGGATQTGNLNDIQVFDVGSKTWSTLTPKGTPPSPRTHHVNVCVGNSFIVYSGGQSGADPVTDRQVHCYDAPTNTWSTLNIKGDPPKPRHGHIMAAVGNKVYLHGGMANQTFYDDLHVLDLDKKTWTLVKNKKVYPSARAAHGGVAVGSDIYVFGGMNKEGALEDMYKLDTASMKWTKIELDGPPPTNRLDFGMCAIQLDPPPAEMPSGGGDGVASGGQQVKAVLEQQLQGLNLTGKTDGATSSPKLAAGQQDQDTESSSTTVDGSSVVASGEPGQDQVAAVAGKTLDMLFLFGGMDTEGEIFDDSLVYLVS